MSNPVVNVINLTMNAGKAVAGPKIASVLGPRGIPMPKFCDAFNKATSNVDHKRYAIGDPLNARVYVYADKTYDLVISNSPSVMSLLKKAAGVDGGASNPGKDVAAKIRMSVIRDIAELKMSDMNTDNVDSAIKMVAGTARSMGIEVVD